MYMYVNWRIPIYLFGLIMADVSHELMKEFEGKVVLITGKY